MERSREPVEPAQAQLGLWDAVSIIVGIVIGAGIYKSPSLISANVPGPWIGLAAWALCGFLAFAGALCYAELATTYPRSGGDYVYISKAFGPVVGFLFGWAQLAAILTGSIAAMSYVFADYADQLWGFDPQYRASVAMLAVVALSVLNLAGVVLGKWVQNLLTAAKIVGLGAIIYAGFSHGNAASFQSSSFAAEKENFDLGKIGFAMILILYTYGGWNDAAFVAAEVKNQRRNMPLALLLGVAIITIIYLAINVAYICALGFEGVQNSKTVAADTLRLTLGDSGSKGMSILVMISSLGALNGLIMTGSRVYSTLGSDYRSLSWLGQWSPRFQSPLWSLLVQAVVSLVWIAAVGTDAGRQGIDGALERSGFQPIPWKFNDGFETLVASTAPVFWVFFLLTGLALFNLRFSDPNVDRPFALRMPLYPIVPLLFCATCCYMLYSSINYAGSLALIPIAFMLPGLPFYLFSSRRLVVESPGDDRQHP